MLKNTKDLNADGVKILVYGHAGAGKTSLIKTLPNPVVISAEGGLLSIADSDIPYVDVKGTEDIYSVFEFLNGPEGQQFESIALDSISEIAEVVLNQAKKETKDPRQAYGSLMEVMQDLIRAFRDIKGKNVYFSCKCEKMADEQGRILYSPSMPGAKLGQSLPYFFDEVLALRVERDTDGNTQRALMCDTDGLWSAKDRSGKLDAWEAPDLGEIINKIKGIN